MIVEDFTQNKNQWWSFSRKVYTMKTKIVVVKTNILSFFVRMPFLKSSENKPLKIKENDIPARIIVITANILLISIL